MLSVLGLVLVTAALMSAFSTLTLRYTLTEHLDDKLAAASERAANRRNGLEQGPAGPPQYPDVGSTEEVAPGLDAAGQSTGTLTVIITSGSVSSATYIDAEGHYVSLSPQAHADLLPVRTDGHPMTVSITSLGDYRVVASKDDSGAVVVTGLSMEDDNRLVRTQLLIEAGIALVGALVIALAGRSMVRSSLAPLERVAVTAQHVASQPLERGEVSIDERVPAEDLVSSTEVSQVGTALNTLLDRVEDALGARQRSETQVRQFVADASHELRTPLASIRGYTELIQREGADANLPEEAEHALQRVHSESLRMTALVEDLLLLASLDAGRGLVLTEVDLVGLLVDTVADARAAGPDHDWELVLEALEPPAGNSDRAAQNGSGIPQGCEGQEPEPEEEFVPEPPLVMGDEPRLRQVLVNLLANARVHTPPGTRVTTTLLRHDNHLVVRIADNGPGIEPALRERLFERFARGDTSRERRTGSTGLGMSIALAIVQSHQGTLTVESATRQEDPEHHGTTFAISLPAVEVR
ncbi:MULTISPECIES: HAMP domain-containing sensor histidine kinase [Actinomyces]|nr:HAMP domain-containing sensor histidine kinase [Actinomyces sp. 2119]